jgi:hypothetical protein
MPRREPWKPVDEMSPSDFSVYMLTEAYRSLVEDTGIELEIVRDAFAEMLGYLLAADGDNPVVVTKVLNDVILSMKSSQEKAKSRG